MLNFLLMYGIYARIFHAHTCTRKEEEEDFRIHRKVRRKGAHPLTFEHARVSPNYLTYNKPVFQ